MPKTIINADPVQIRHQIDSAPHGSKEAVTEMVAGRLGVSKHKLRAWLRKKTGKKKESPQPRKISLEPIYMMAELKAKSRRYGDGNRELPTWRCIRQLQDMGIEGADDLSVSSADRLLREIGYRDQRSYVRFECDYALQQVMADWSFSKYFRVVGYDEQAGDWILKATSKRMDYKKDDKRMRILIGGIVDAYSRVRYHRAMIGTGESAELCLEFFQHFFTRPMDDLAFRHVGWHFRIDKGSFSKSLGQSFFNAIDRKFDTNEDGPEANGKIERGWQDLWYWEQDFAMRIGNGNTILLGDYNRLLLAECIRLQEQKHPYWTNKRRVDLYQQSVLRQNPKPESIDVDLKQIAFTVYERTVTADQTVSIDGEHYYVPVMAGEFRTRGRRIRVLINKNGELVGELLDRHADTFIIEPFKHRSYGDFTGTPDMTLQQRIDADLNKNISFTDEARKRVGNMVWSAEADAPKRLMPKDQPVQVDSPFLDKPEPAVFSTKFKAMSYVNSLLMQQGLGLDDDPDLVDYFEGIVIDSALDREAITQQVNDFLNIYNNKTGTL